MRFINSLFATVVLYAVMMMLLGLCSCSPVKQATKHYNKAKEKHLPTVANLSRLDWPCGVSKTDTVETIIKGKTDTIIKEQIHYVDCPDTAVNAPVNSVIKVPVKVPCVCPETSPDTLVRYITQFEKDPRDSIYYNYLVGEVKKDLSKAKQGLNTWRALALVFIGLVVISIFFIIRKFKII